MIFLILYITLHCDIIDDLQKKENSKSMQCDIIIDLDLFINFALHIYPAQFSSDI